MNPRTERDLLRDYAREVVTVQSYGVPWQAGPRGELAGKMIDGGDPQTWEI